MKKLIIASLLALSITLSLCSCAGTSESDTQSLVSNPFETSENENSETPANDERYELYDKYQSGALQFDFSEMNDAQNIEYNGEKINITFSANAANNREDITIGYMAFIGGIPQVISVNGSEEAETVSVNFPKDEITNVSINIKPCITKELEDKKELNLQIVSIFNIGYVPQGKYAGFGFGNINAGSTVYTACLTMNEKAETVELSGNAEFENIPASDSSLKSYTLKKAGEMSSGAILKMFSVNNETEHLILDKSTQTCDVLFDGADFDTYNVFFYVNHKRVQVNGKDYAAVSAKAGYVPKLTATLENVNNHDIVYAIAVPLTNDYTKARILKTTSRLSFSPDDEIITNPTTQPPADTSADVPESEPGITDIDRLSDPLFAYTPMGYIDNDMRYLLLYREKNLDAADGYCYIVYNSTDKTISDELYTIDNRCLRTSYGDGYFVILDNNYMLNGGDVTLKALRKLQNESPETLCNIIGYLKEGPLYKTVTAGGKKFLLCHSGLDNFSPERSPADYTADELIWAWPELTDRYFDDCITVFGHTPTKSYGKKYNGKILKTDTWIDVDVGVPYGNNPCLLRLDDLKEFYL